MATDVLILTKALLGDGSQHAASARPDANRTLPINAPHTESTRTQAIYSRAAFNAMPLRPLTKESR